jgi:protein subunit release factor A
MALGVSLWESGKKEEAHSLITEVSQYKKSELSHHPVILWMQYRIALEQSPESQETRAALKTFLKSSSDQERILIDGWDPYRVTDHRVTLAK